MNAINFIRKIICLVLFVCLCLTGSLLWLSGKDERTQKELMNDIASYKPTQSDFNIKKDSNGKLVVNPSVVDLHSKYPDVVGWLTIDDTAIDYPFVQSKDNEDYLRSDLNRKSSVAGTIFTDCRCDGTKSFMTILYGHNMKNGTMFADLRNYSDEKFWNEHKTGTLYEPNATYLLERFAYIVVSSSNSKIYAPNICSEREISDFCKYLKKNSRRYDDTDLTINNKILVLSTCNYEFTGARNVIIMKMTKIK